MRKNKSAAAAIGLIIAGAGLLALISNTTGGKKVAPIPKVPADTAQNHAIAAGGEQFFGYVPNPEESKRFVGTLPARDLRTQAPALFGRGSIDVFLYRALNDAHLAFYGREFKVGTQGIGDCVSWGWKHGADTHLAVMWKVGDSAEWREAATESIYGGSRVEANGGRLGGYSDGSYGAAAAKWVKDWGVTFRTRYDDFGFDLTTYDSQRAKSWGNFGNGGQGDQGRFDDEAKKHPVRQVALVKTFEEAAAAIASGYPVPVCSGQGFSSRRDSNGFAAASGRWSHCMCFVGVRFNPDGLLCLNSWGTTWISGPKYPPDQPDGSFWVDRRTAENMLSGADSFAVSGYAGFPYRDLKHGDWVKAEPRQGPRNPVAFAATRRYDSRDRDDNPFHHQR